MSDTLTAEHDYETETGATLEDYPADGQYDFDEAGTQDLSGDQAGSQSDSGEDSPQSKQKQASQAKSNRALYRKVAAKTLDVAAAPQPVRELSASLLGCPADTVELATAIMAAPRTAQAPLTDIGTIVTAIEEEPMEAGIIATSLGRTRLKAVWSLLHVLGAVGTPAPPASDVKAALPAVKAIRSLSDDNHGQLAAAGELLKRS